MTQGKLYHISDVLSITTGRLVSTRHMDGIYDILNFMTGDNLYTHQLPRASRQCRPCLVKQYPFLAEIVPPDFDSLADTEVRVAVEEWVAGQASAYGDLLLIEPLPSEEYEFKDPIQELVGIVGEEKVIAVSSDISQAELEKLVQHIHEVDDETERR